MHDLRFALRLMLRAPAFTIVAIATLALGIGANTAIFTLFNAVLLQSLPVREPSRLVIFGSATGEGTSSGDPGVGAWNLFSYESYQFLAAANLPFESLTAVRSGEDTVSVRVGGAPQAELAQSHLVAGNYFSVMGVSALIGRTLAPADDRPDAPPVAVVSHGFWTNRLRADPAAVGAIAYINGAAYTIVGVAPRDFFGERVRRPPDFWIPLVFQPQVEMRPSYLDRPRAYWLTLIARLTRDATRGRAETAATAALRQFLTATAGTNLTGERKRAIEQSRIEVANGAGGISIVRYRYSQPLRVLLVVVALVLLLACANVANLLLSRAAARRGEITVRLALGAPRGRLIRQLLTESLVLAICGGAAGVLLARWAVTALVALMVSRTTPLHANLDARVLAFTAAVAGLAGVAFGISPALAAGRFDLVGALKARDQGGRGGRPFGLTRTLVAAQIAISLVLIVGATLFARSLLNLEMQPLGFEQDRVLLARPNPRLAGYKPADAAQLHRRVYERLTTLAGVTSATIARYSPMSGSRSSSNSGVVEGYAPGPKENVQFETQLVGPTYIETMGMRLVQGREIGLQDAQGTPRVGMVDEAFVRKYMPGQNPIGRHFGVDGGRGPDVEIVGVLKDARFQPSEDDILPVVFLALFQQTDQFALDAEVAIRTAGDPAAAAGELRRAIADVDPNLAINAPRILRNQVASNFDSQRLAARLVGFFAALAVLLACVGLYGVIAQSVQRRTSEIGVRIALGAKRGTVLWMVLRDTLVLLAVGLGIGVPAAFGAARLVASQLYGLSVTAAGPFVFAAVLFSLVSVMVGLVPAVRAARVDPMIALRYE